MKGREIRTFMFLLCALVFAGLLLSGGHRLIVTSSDAGEAPDMRLVTAYLCCAPAEHVPLSERQSVSQTQGAERERAALHSAQIVRPARMQANADANGNVLRSVSYMRSVYQSFDLGDGFV